MGATYQPQWEKESNLKLPFLGKEKILMVAAVTLIRNQVHTTYSKSTNKINRSGMRSSRIKKSKFEFHSTILIQDKQKSEKE